ncbi:MAG: glycogen/starch/alpha-glucan phosphorylase [Parachlamydiaceae bacterium]|nr:glycogen/starch/alpha-glucan phosphorylase [Parachlamydiaceae bacterium]
MDVDVGYQAEMLASKTKHYLVTAMGRISEEANDEEFYRALCFALREEIVINWQASSRTFREKDARMLYYLSLEYLPGRIFSNNIGNLAANEIIEIVLRKMNRNLGEIINKESDPALGNGGLGRLASCFLDSLATQHYPAQAYGLRYHYGIFEQQLWEGLQIEAPDCWLLSENPWEFRRDLRRVSVHYFGTPAKGYNIHNDEILFLNGDAEEVSALPFDIPIIGYSKTSQFSVVTLRLWSTKESPRNFQLQSYNAGRLDRAAENTLLTDVLYPNDEHDTGKRIRLKQEFLLVSASLQDIIRHYLTRHQNFRSFVDKVRIQINDTHPALVIPELIRILTTEHDISWNMAVEMTQHVTGYTNHTILREALEEWDQSLVSYLLPRQYRIIERLNHEFCNRLRVRNPVDEGLIQRMSILENGKVRMANLAILGSHKVNGVAELHTEILKKTVFKDFYDLFPEKFINITNGITQRRWLSQCNPDLAKFITHYIGEGWICDFTQIAKLQAHASNPECQAEFWAIKRKNKASFIQFFSHENKLRDNSGHKSNSSPLLDVNSLFDVQVKRFHEYKRQLLNLLHVIVLYQEMLQNPHHSRIPRTVIFSGKSAAGYEVAKQIIRLIYCVARKINNDSKIQDKLKVIFVENYNVSHAEIIIPAADLSEQISLAGMEASGTGNMKLAINGALTIGTDDGANIEMRQAITDKWWPFKFGASAEEVHQMKSKWSYNPWVYYENDSKLKNALDALKDYTFAVNESEHYAFCNLFYKLLESTNPDVYFNLYDFKSYYETQKKAEELFQQPLLWSEYALNNIAGMGSFSSDGAVKNYCEKIWQLSPVPIQQDILERIRYEYKLLDVCRVYK